MPYPYKKMTQEDFDKIIEITDNERVWVGDEIAKEYKKGTGRDRTKGSLEE